MASVMTMRQQGQREEDKSNNQIKLEYVGGKGAVENTMRGRGRQRKASRRRKK